MNLQSGYFTEDGFTTRLKDWQSPTTPPGMKEDDYDGDEVYRAADGKVFTDYTEAKNYNAALVIPELNEVLEGIEKLKILCATHKEKIPVLATIEDALQTVASRPDELMDKYHDSSCY